MESIYSFLTFLIIGFIVLSTEKVNGQIQQGALPRIGGRVQGVIRPVGRLGARTFHHLETLSNAVIVPFKTVYKVIKWSRNVYTASNRNRRLAVDIHTANQRCVDVLGILDVIQAPLVVVNGFNDMASAFKKDISPKKRIEHLYGAVQALVSTVSDVRFTVAVAQKLRGIHGVAARLGPAITITEMIVAVPRIGFDLLFIINAHSLTRQINKIGSDREKLLDLFLGGKNESLAKQRSRQELTSRFFHASHIVDDLKDIQKNLKSEDKLTVRRAEKRFDELMQFTKNRGFRAQLSRAIGVIDRCMSIVGKGLLFSPLAPVGAGINAFQALFSYIHMVARELFLGDGIELGAKQEWKTINRVMDTIVTLDKGTEADFQKMVEWIEGVCNEQEENLPARFKDPGKVIEKAKNIRDLMSVAVALPVEIDDKGNKKINSKEKPLAQALTLFDEEIQKALEVMSDIDEARMKNRFFTRRVKVVESASVVKFVFDRSIDTKGQKQGNSGISRIRARAESKKMFKKMKRRKFTKHLSIGVLGVATIVSSVGTILLFVSSAWPVGVSLVVLGIGVSVALSLFKIALSQQRIINRALIKEMRREARGLPVNHVAHLPNVLKSIKKSSAQEVSTSVWDTRGVEIRRGEPPIDVAAQASQ